MLLNPIHHNLYMVVVCLVGIVGTFVVSYTRARAESLGIDAKVGVMQRPERIVLLSAPQALFGLFWNGWVLMGIIILLTVTSCITAVQRIALLPRDEAFRFKKADTDGQRSVAPQKMAASSAASPTRRAKS